MAPNFPSDAGLQDGKASIHCTGIIQLPTSGGSNLMQMYGKFECIFLIGKKMTAVQVGLLSYSMCFLFFVAAVVVSAYSAIKWWFFKQHDSQKMTLKMTQRFRVWESSSAKKREPLNTLSFTLQKPPKPGLVWTIGLQ